MVANAQPAALRRLIDEVGAVDQVGVEERVAKHTTRSIKKAAKLKGLRFAVSMVDLTTLEGKDTPGKVASLCAKAVRPHDTGDIPPVAAVSLQPRSARRDSGPAGVTTDGHYEIRMGSMTGRRRWLQPCRSV